MCFRCVDSVRNSRVDISSIGLRAENVGICRTPSGKPSDGLTKARVGPSDSPQLRPA